MRAAFALVLLLPFLPTAAAEDVCVTQDALHACNGGTTLDGDYGAQTDTASAAARHGADWSAACVERDERVRCAYVNPYGWPGTGSCDLDWYADAQTCAQAGLYVVLLEVDGERTMLAVPWDAAPRCVVDEPNVSVCRYLVIPQVFVEQGADVPETCVAEACASAGATAHADAMQQGTGGSFGLRRVEACAAGVCRAF